MRIVVAGASGLIGQALVPALRAQGHQVTVLVRRVARNPDEQAWLPASAGLGAGALDDVDAVINLAGENLAGGRWTAARKAALWSSRTESTRCLVAALRAARPRTRVLVNASAVGFYGDRGEEELRETSAGGCGFLAELCAAWEREARRAEGVGVRVVCARFGVVVARQGGALARMLPAFRLGLGGRLGDGRAWLSWAALDDAVRALIAAVADDHWSGPVNLVAPSPVRNADWAATLGRVMHRPAIVPAPAWMLRLVLGELARATLLASTRVCPDKLQTGGFVFRQPELAPLLQRELR